MKELGIILGATTLFCVLVFGAAWLAAGWMGAGPGWLRGSRRRRRDRH